MERSAANAPAKWTAVGAFAAIYLLWGSTFFAIRIVVSTVPPFFAAGIRFVLAGTLLLACTILRGTALPTKLEWPHLAFSALLLFVPSYGGLFWAERVVPSGIAATLAATIPLWIALVQTLVFKKSRLHARMLFSMVCGFCGVAILSLRGSEKGSASLVPYLILIAGQIAWSFGTVLTKYYLRLPSSKLVTSGAQMGLGGLMLLVLSGATGEMAPFPHITIRAGVAVGYLIVAGSIIAFTAYVWLLAHYAATKVASYAYVNPVVALGIGYWSGHETLNLEATIGVCLILVGVVMSLREPSS